MNAAAGESRNTIAAEISELGAEPAERHFLRQRADMLAHLGRILVEPGRRDPAGRHRVHAHRRPFERRRLGEIEHAGARGARMAHAGHAVPHVGDHVHDRAAVLLHPLRVGFARHQEAAGEIGAHHRVPALRGNLLQRRAELPARIVDQEIDAGRNRRAPRAPPRARALPRGCRRRSSARCRPRPRSRARPLRACRACGRSARRVAPSAASSCAVQRPMPLPAPVTMPAWPANRPRGRPIEMPMRWSSKVPERL